MITIGFRSNTYATVWSVETVSNTVTKARISISRKNKNTGEYEQDFSGFVSFVGTAAAAKAAKLKEKDRIKLGDVDVSNRYDKEKQREYTTFKVFSFEKEDEGSAAPAAKMSVVDDGEVDEDKFPF